MYKVVRCDKCHRFQLTAAIERVVCKFCGKTFKSTSAKEFRTQDEARDYLYSIT